MVVIQKPLTCPKCKNLIENYTINKFTNKIDFKCKCRNVIPLSENQYITFLRTNTLPNKYLKTPN